MLAITKTMILVWRLIADADDWLESVMAGVLTFLGGS
jgi:hypothetical protein